jgi:hypothetical protein
MLTMKIVGKIKKVGGIPGRYSQSCTIAQMVKIAAAASEGVGKPIMLETPDFRS